MADERAGTPGWEGDAVVYDRWFDGRWGRHAFAVEARALVGAVPPLEGVWVLDAGCGTGRLAAALAGAGAIVVGVDPDAGMAALAAARLPGRCGRGVVEDLPFPDGVFDVAVAVTLLEFVDDPPAAMSELARLTRPGGRILVGALNPHSPRGLTHRCLLRSGVQRGARFLDRRRLVALGAPHGSTRLYPALYAPAWLPGLAAAGPIAEALGRLVPAGAAFQVLAVDKAGA